jgi:L-alanine-DL-glutamate epimerase-like enolase superfamily enzyme
MDEASIKANDNAGSYQALPASGPAKPEPNRWSTVPLRIRSIETVALRVPLARVFRGSKYQMDKRCTIITRVITDEGIVGEAYNGDEDEAQAAIRRIIHQELAPALAGHDVFDVEGCWEAMLPSSFDILRERKLATQAIACVDSAIWDALGKALGMPLYRLWGGYRDALPIIAIGGYYDRTAHELAAEMEQYLHLELSGCKFKVGGATPDEDAARFRVAREAAGPGFVLMADANQGYTVREAVQFCRMVESLDVRWFEEPCRWTNDRRAMRDVRYLTGVPVAAGQGEVSLSGARDLIVDGAIDVCNFDASWAAGPTQWRRAAAIAAAFDVQMGHHEEPQISAHLLAAVPHGTYVECFHPERDPLFWNLIANRPEIRDGLYSVPSGPGFGIQLDTAYVERYTT